MLSLIAVAAVLPSAPQEFDFTLDPSASTSLFYADIETVLNGTLIGDYDATANPGGTRTVNGLFGGGTNELVPVTTTVDNNATFNGGPTGTFSMGLDTALMTVDFSLLDVDVLGGTTGTGTVDVTLLFNTFRTYSPDSLYVGGIPFTIPFGSINVTAATATQSAPSSSGILTPGSGSNDYGFGALVPVTMTLTADLNGAPITIPPFPLYLPVTGTVTLTSTGATATADFNFSDQTFTNDPFPGFQITDQPLGLPTILPPGSTANVLFSATVTSLDTDIQVDFQLQADGVPNCGFTRYCDANANSTGFPAQIAAAGSPSVAAKNLVLSASGLPTKQFGYFMMAQTQGYVPLFGGSDGNLCLGAPIVRFSKIILNSGLSGTVSFGPDFDNLPQGTVFTAGSTWNFQLWHRDFGGRSNTTDGVSVLFCN